MWGSGAYGQLMTVIQLEEVIPLDSGNLDPDPTIPSTPETKLPFFQPKRTKIEQDRPHNHLYGTRSKTQTKAVFQTPELKENREETTGWRSLESMFTPWV